MTYVNPADSKTRGNLPLKLLLVLTLLFTAFLSGGAFTAQAAGSDMLVVNKKTNKLAYFSGGKLVKTFPVATGKTQSLTPEGSFDIVVKVKNRPYYKEKIPGGDPANPLGDRWLGLEVGNTYGTTYAIHGNNNESSIGKYVSAGCIRMHNEDIHWLYPQVARKTKVVITSSTQDMESIAVKYGYAVATKETKDKTFAGTLVVNGVATKLKDPMVLDQSRVYIPLRESVVLLGGRLQSNPATGEWTITVGKNTVKYKALSEKAVVNGKSVAVTASRNENNRMMLPLANVTKMFGLQVKWNGSAKSVAITK
ncbi:hypothetical protein B9T62_00305 [Paenibacillus donghaensis]|uniref:L,D-TPase catalytic domain-containing protein n=2 Tax=Paenibacillus donghaensis TaxID=414771 RepID=A0A2Z2KQJ6_9BACL|nr:hypothetical protein B9T62_00305 [Paenibacillus donghaensis]